MTRTAFIYSIVLFAVIFAAIQNSSAQTGPCLLGVGNCPQTTTTNNTNNVDRGSRQVHIKDSRATEIWQAKQKNQRYLLVLQTYSESGLLCEERAWVGGSYAGNAGEVVVNVGPAKKVCFDPLKPIWTAQQVNSVEQYIDSWTNAIYQWAKYEENMVVYLNQNRNNPQAVSYAQGEINKSQAWGNYYRNMITSYRNGVNQVAP